MKLAAGRLRQRIRIEQNNPVRVGAGREDAWSAIATVPAEVLPKNGGEIFAQGLERSTQFYAIMIRFRTDIKVEHRLIWGDITMAIRTCADPSNRRESLLIIAESGVPT